MPSIALAPLSVPLRRRRETLAVLLAILLIPISCTLFVALLLAAPTRPYAICYFIWTLIDRGPEYAHPRTLAIARRFVLWNWMRDYFPVDLVLDTPTFDCSRTFVFGYHPHGVLSFGAWVCFATEAMGISALMPGIRLKLLTLKTNFYLPIFREIIQWLSIGRCDRACCERILARGPGSAIMLVVGGAQESLRAAPGTYDLVLRKRLGFVRLAIATRSALVPVLALGETDVYGLANTAPSSVVARLQRAMKDAFGFTLPLFYGRGVFNYTMGLLPHRRRIMVVVGAPLEPADVIGADGVERAVELSRLSLNRRGNSPPLPPCDEQLDALARRVQEAYVARLQELWERHHAKLPSTAKSVLRIVE